MSMYQVYDMYIYKYIYTQNISGYIQTMVG